jgi:hypothetical protein
VKARPIDIWLRDAPESGSVVEFPIDESNAIGYVFGSSTHQKPLFGMFYGAYLPQEYKRLLPILQTFPSEASVRVLRERGVGYVVVNQTLYPDWSRKQEEIAGLGLEYQDKIDQSIVYRVTLLK